MELFLINEEKRTIKDLLYLCNLLGINTKNTKVAENIILCRVSLEDINKVRCDLTKDFVNCLCAYDVDDIETMLKVKYIMEGMLGGDDNEKLS